MNALSGLVDALMAARLAPRLDALGIKPEATIGAPAAVIPIEGVENDVRLPSNAALDRLLPGGMPDGQQPGGGTGTSSAAAHLSMAARVISAVLADLQAEPGPVRGAAPALASPGTASSAALAGSLAQTVADSGLFYESHLLEFASGTRTLAQLAQEPQMRWSQPVPAQAGGNAASAQPGQQAGQAGQGATPAAQAAALPADAAEVPASAVMAKDVLAATAASQAAGIAASAADDLLSAAGKPAGAPAQAAGGDDNAAAAATPQKTPPGAAPADADLRMDATRVQAAYRWAEAPAAPDHAATARLMPRADEAIRHASAFSASGAQPLPASVDVIHPQAVTLVHQQLDLLATSVFRWSGEAWPGVPMNWSIEEEHQDRESGAPEEDTPRRWSTMVSLDLPKLGAVDLRVSLTGPMVHAHLAASDTGTVAALRADGGTLSHRFEAAGLRLQELQVTGRAAS